ncbi:Triose-phosphate Transporter family [Novymonas esmeraldas]|uniref:Triose-phosphate Transporter family n=1 Tax=Novymonas esmeraldas TaxID=1808958 RepID=A0AAW0EXQ4_9TRYP
MLTEQVRTVLYLALNAFSSIGIVYTNKVLFKGHGFSYGTLLTVIHFFITSLGLLGCHMMGVFEPKRIPLANIMPLCISFCGFVALTNMSLVYNSIGFYQLIKVLTTPLLVVIQTFFYDKTFSRKVKLSLAVTCVGVAIATVSDASATFIGTAVALSALLVTCMYQIWVGTKQSEFQCDGFQLLYNQAPISCAMLIPVAYFSDNLKNDFYMPCFSTMVLIVFSGFLAFLVNISIFLVIGKTSPVTYNVLGHFKLCVILSLGFLLFGDVINMRVFTGIVLTLTGVFWYTNLKMSESTKEKEGTKIVVKHDETQHDSSEGDEKRV